ncbi:MAG: hypothetical protein ABH863_01370 [Candidatus Micrarchaeota archaeon]
MARELPLHRLTDEGRIQRALGLLKQIHGYDPQDAHLAADALEHIAGKSRKPKRPRTFVDVNVKIMRSPKSRDNFRRHILQSIPKNRDVFFKAAVAAGEDRFDDLVRWATEQMDPASAHALPLKAVLSKAGVGYLPPYLARKLRQSAYSRIIVGMLLNRFFMGGYLDARTSERALTGRIRETVKGKTILPPSPEVHTRYRNELLQAVSRFRELHPLQARPKKGGL